ncbi:hypothetical protein EK21DRAFT_95892 [Setomelanomma holmii]|uniref:Uncharacterized protein n=1 Tax=Setomelanomma holmii TaxID=210430 RepID=A0A9P4HNX9_9PLEO|nr:hypothetical protein EK21DRAFT_95892 [Setomelanomma holmii]
MDEAPNCAICNAPAYPECPCESERLQIAVKQAEQRAMDERLAEIRDWVINHARQHILKAFESLTSIRKQAHAAYLASLPNYDIYMRYSGRPPIPHMYVSTLQSQIAEAHAELKRGIDADWRASVLRYPVVLDYFYSLIELRLPSDRSQEVIQPPFAAAGYADRGYDRGYIDASSVSVEKKKKKRRDREGSAGPERVHPAMHRIMRGPPPVPTPPLQHGAFPRPPGPYPY